MIANALSLSMSQGKPPQIAVVGSGISALTCAREVARLSGSKDVEKNGLSGAEVTLFTSRSKMSTQMGPKNQAKPLNGKPFFDYGVQYITAQNEEFKNEVQRWADLGLCTRLNGDEVGIVSSENGYTPFKGGSGNFVGNGGMSVLITKLIDDAENEFLPDGNFRVQRGFPNQKKKIQGLSKNSEGKWILQTKEGETVAPFDFVVGGFAQHCLTDPFLLSGGDASKSMLSCLRRVESNQLIVMQVSFSPPLPSKSAPFTAAHVSGEDCLSFVANNSKKPHQDQKFRTENNSMESWTLISTASFGEREFNTNTNGYRKIAEEEMLEALSRILNIPNLRSNHNPKINRINHWEDGLSSNVPPSSRGCLLDASQNLGWCGDFCTDRPNLEGAAQSGRAMAHNLNLYYTSKNDGGGNFKAAAPEFLPSSVSWIPRTALKNEPATSSHETLVDIGQFGHSQHLLPSVFSHTNLVPSSLNGYDKALGKGAGGQNSRTNSNKNTGSRRPKNRTKEGRVSNSGGSGGGNSNTANRGKKSSTRR